MKLAEALRRIKARGRKQKQQARPSRSHHPRPAPRLTQIYELICTAPGIEQRELPELLGISHRNASQFVLRLCAEGKIERVSHRCRGIKHAHLTFKLYPYGKIPALAKPERRIRGHWQENDPDLNSGHCDTFRYAFDEAFGLLYLELRELSLACQLCQPETINSLQG